MIISNYITPCIWLRMTPWPFSFTLPCMLKTLKTNIYDPASLVLVTIQEMKRLGSRCGHRR
ncbi:hypothetical protein AAZX31_10G130700 [Glycine max]|uniref:Uncharacterized protein n=1 Tax=Glycine max TaxID=3847 RepID=A0A0R0I3S1_SOYBN|nr:hypothetical protein GLYMA_10G139100v4 [Glycine max]